MEFMADFPDDATCLEWLWTTRYAPDGRHADCPKCELRREFKRYETSQQRQSWTCTACGLHLHPTAGTIFHKSSTSLHLWFDAMYLMTTTPASVSRQSSWSGELGVTYKTAWRMFTLIRNELMTQDDNEPLGGAVEADETYVGGKRARARPNGRAVATARSPRCSGWSSAAVGSSTATSPTPRRCRSCRRSKAGAVGVGRLHRRVARLRAAGAFGLPAPAPSPLARGLRDGRRAPNTIEGFGAGEAWYRRNPRRRVGQVASGLPERAHMATTTATTAR